MMRSEMKKDKLLRVSTVAQRIGVCRQSVYNLIVSESLQAIRIGPRAGIRIYESEIERFLKVREHQAGIKGEYLQEIS